MIYNDDKNKFIKTESQNKSKNIKLQLFKELFKKQAPSCSLIIIDNFYNNPMEIRDFALSCDFSVDGNGNFINGNSLFPGARTFKSYANEDIKNKIQTYVEPFDGKITIFDCDDGNSSGNGCFQYVKSFERTLCHVDKLCWAGILYLTPYAPLESGTNFCKNINGTSSEIDMISNETKLKNNYYDETIWMPINQIGNLFNRLVLFNSKNYHIASNMFGESKENSRLFQLFFFSTERGDNEIRHSNFLNKNHYF
jgi:hypothetical protein